MDEVMVLRYKVTNRQWPSGRDIYIEAHQITERLLFDDYIKCVNDACQTRMIDEINQRWAFHPERNYNYVIEHYNFYRLETDQLIQTPKDKLLNIGDYVRYSPATDEFELWDVDAAKQRPNLELVDMIDTPQDDGEPDMEPSEDAQEPEHPTVTRPPTKTTASLELLGAGQPYTPRHN